MAILKMKRIEILAMLTESKEIIDYVQRCGDVQIDDMLTEQLEPGHFYTMSTGSMVSQLTKFRDYAEKADETLNAYVPEKGGIAKALTPRRELTMSEFLEQSKKVDAYMAECYAVNGAAKKIQDLRAVIVRSEVLADQLKPWESLDIPTATRGTAYTTVFIGSISEPLDRGMILEKLAETNPDLDAEIEIVSSDKNQTCLVAMCGKQDAAALEQALRTIGFTAVSDPSKRLPREQIADLQKHTEECRRKIEEQESMIREKADEREHIRFLADYFTMRIDKYEAFENILMDENVFVLTGYAPEKEAEKLKKKLESKYDAAVSITETDAEDENVPVQLKEKAYPATMESITEMYSLPGKGDVDPNPFMSVFYFCLFGLMLGDAGYGLVMTVICLILKIKYKNAETRKRNTLNYGLGCGIATTIWGWLQNSWFGDLPKWVANGLRNNNPTDFFSAHHIYWFEPLAYNNITRFLMLCFTIGILHLFFGLCINIYKNFRNHNGFNGIVENVPYLLILVGIFPVINTFIEGDALIDVPGKTDPFNHTQPIYDFLTNNASIFYILLAAGFALVWLCPVLEAIHDHKPVSKCLTSALSGLYGVYNAASGYLGDILSYARLLALGLCTGVIASVINQLGATPLGGNWFFFILIFIIGHTVNIAINLIGAYVHANRLQYVEFFSKFYEGGGEPFRPLQVNSKSFKFKEEN